MSTADLVRLALVAGAALLLVVAAHLAAKSAFGQSQQIVPHDLNFYRVFYSVAVTIILLVPGLGLLLLPFGVAGATRLVMKARA
jgi:hypothetical protein